MGSISLFYLWLAHTLFTHMLTIVFHVHVVSVNCHGWDVHEKPLVKFQSERFCLCLVIPLGSYGLNASF